MDATAGGEQKAPAPPSDDATPTSAPEVRQGPLPEGVAGGAAVESGGEEDEQVERFYALLANVRALRGMYTAGGGGGGASADSGGSRKRVRGAEPPWRPAFRMEDFEEAVDAGCAKKKERRGVVAARRSAENEAPGEEEEGEGEVVEGDRVPASQRAGVLTSQLATHQ